MSQQQSNRPAHPGFPVNPAAASRKGEEKIAGYGKRIGAAFIDGLIWMVFYIAIGVLYFTVGREGVLGSLLSLVSSVFFFAYYPFFWGVENPITDLGQSPGKKLMGIKIVREDGEDFTIRNGALYRFIGYWFTSFTLGLGLLLVFFNDKNQALHDKIFKTLVVEA